MKIKEAIIKKGEWLLDALKRIGYDMIPTNTILDKTLTGLGATHSEIHSERNSIIIEPNVPVILGKLNNNDNLEAVYEKCTPYVIKKYLQMDISFKKILTTPESFKKIREAAQSLGIDIYKQYFCLFDECEKITQDIDYRRKITQPIYDFFLFENKAFVSATPLPISHKEFEKQNFQKIKIMPQYDYKIFCSQKSIDKLFKRGIDKAYPHIDYPLAKYNFFTCRFYSGLDIVLRKHKPDIILLTDFHSANWTMIDPMTEAIQIQGRFRKTVMNDITYNSLTHISTINPSMRIRGNEELDIRIRQFIDDYNSLQDKHDKETDKIKQEAIFDDMQRLKYYELIDERGEINSFSIDNLYNEERVKSYYTSANALYQAYINTGFFNVTLHDVTECVGDDDIRKLNNTKQIIEKRKILVHLLYRIYNDFEQGKISFEERNGFINLLREQAEAQFIINAYMKIGKAGIENAKYQKGLIDKAMKQYDKEQVKTLRFSPEVLKDIKEEFELGVYIGKNEIKNRIQQVYNEHSIGYKVTQDTIKDYYYLKESNSKGVASFKLEVFKFE